MDRLDAGEQAVLRTVEPEIEDKQEQGPHHRNRSHPNSKPGPTSMVAMAGGDAKYASKHKYLTLGPKF